MVEFQDIKTTAEEALAEMAARDGASGTKASKNEAAGMAEAGAPKNEAAMKGNAIAEGNAGGLFLVEVRVSGDEAEVFIDSDGTAADGKPRRVTVDDCVILTKAIEARFDREAPENDFSLTVSSAGIGQPLKVMRQYLKLIGRQVEVVLASGAKFVATLEGVEPGADDDIKNASITLSYPEKQKVEGKKRPETVTVTKTFALSEVKSTKEHIDFK